MEAFLNKLLNESDQWLTTKAIEDKNIFESTLHSVFNELSLNINQSMIDSLWTKIQQKYEQTATATKHHFFSTTDINEYLKQHQSNNERQKVLLSNKASIKHSVDSNICSAFHRPYTSMSYQHIDGVLDVLLSSSNQCNDGWLSLIELRLNQISDNKINKRLSHKFYRLFVQNLSKKCVKNASKRSVDLLVNQISFICKESAMNILSFIRILFESQSSLEAIAKCLNMRLLTSKLFVIVMNRYRLSKTEWTDTEKLIFLWTLYERNQSGHIEAVCLLKILKWTESVFEEFDGLALLFADKSIDSFSDFSLNFNSFSSLQSIDAESSNQENRVMDVDKMKNEELFVVDIQV